MKVTGERSSTAAAGFNPVFQRHRANYALAARFLGPGRVLDLGCGAGHSLDLLAPRESVGVDRKPAALAGQPRQTVVADMRDLPFEDGSFDLVVNGYMLDLLPKDDIPRALAEFRRVLRPGGRLVLSNMTKGERRRERVWDWLYERGINLTANCRGVLAAPVLRELGFAGVRREYLAQMGFPTEIVTARKE